MHMLQSIKTPFHLKKEFRNLLGSNFGGFQNSSQGSHPKSTPHKGDFLEASGEFSGKVVMEHQPQEYHHSVGVSSLRAGVCARIRNNFNLVYHINPLGFNALIFITGLLLHSPSIHNKTKRKGPPTSSTAPRLL